MAATTDVTIKDASLSIVSWAAVIAGGLAAAALMLFLLALGAGIGLSVVSPWSHPGLTTTHAALGAGIYLLLATIIASAIGGYLAGRLRRRWLGIEEHEVYFRDTAHGLLAWAFATVLSAAVLGPAATAMVGSALAVNAAGQAGQSLDAASYVDRLLRPQLSPPAAPAGTAPAPGTSGEAAQVRPVILGGPALVETRTMLGRLLSQSLPSRDPTDTHGLAAEDRTYMAQIVTAYTGLNPTEANQRVSEATERMRAAAEAARRAARNFALWLAGSLLFGAFASSLAALEGGGLRDGRLRYGPRLAVHRVTPAP
ncbi:hypothetical protein [Reyranella sp.]|jgi:hypothetical protein|uniref:hypothetical protein n=1 Tax=Reyranella sp. TaxID=1929291 RepID=UPI002F93FAF6